MLKIFVKFEITTDYFWVKDERLLEGRTYNPQEFPDRVTLFQTHNDTFQLKVTISNDSQPVNSIFSKFFIRFSNNSFSNNLFLVIYLICTSIIIALLLKLW